VTNPTGFQVELRDGDQAAWVTEVGAGLRRYVARGRELLDGFGEDDPCRSGRGQLLLPWPNRIRDGRYAFGGAERQLPLTEPSKGNAIHGLARWESWEVRERAAHRVVMGLVLHPQPGYPHTLDLSAEYALGDRGLTVRIGARNLGDEPCPFGAGAHPYLAVPSATVDGAALQAPGATRLVSDERGIPVGREPVAGTEYDFRAPRPVGGTVLDTAYADLERGGDGLARVTLDRTTVWLDESFSYVMLFTGDPLPDVERRSLAVEPMTCAPNAFQSGEGLVSLEPGETFSAAWGIVANAS
jgi:aldose 1-epimerase